MVNSKFLKPEDIPGGERVKVMALEDGIGLQFESEAKAIEKMPEGKNSIWERRGNMLVIKLKRATREEARINEA